VDILNSVGEWIGKNGESIYGTSASPFPYEQTWGFSTVKANLLFLHVFDWPESGTLYLEGLNNTVVRAYMLADKTESLVTSRDGQGRLRVTLPEHPTDDIDSVIVLELPGVPNVDPAVVRQEDGEAILLDYIPAETYGKAVKRFNRKGEEGQFHISKMEGPEDIVEWQVDIRNPGVYELFITYAALPEWEGGGYIVESGGERIQGTVRSTEGWYRYRRERIGRFSPSGSGVRPLRIHPIDRLGHSLMYLKSIELVPAEETTESSNAAETR
jgi:alpha-L-fucosidase